jgi:ribosomal protein S18 acetylase RimI-like enzyme
MEIRKKVTRDPELFHMAEVNGAIVGLVVGGFDGWRGLIYHLAVATPFRSQGLGSRWMNKVETRLQAKGCLKFYLMVTVDNPEAGKYYEQRGWYEMDTVRLYGKDLQ